MLLLRRTLEIMKRKSQEVASRGGTGDTDELGGGAEKGRLKQQEEGDMGVVDSTSCR